MNTTITTTYGRKSSRSSSILENVMQGRWEEARRLVESGVGDVNEQDGCYGWSPLHVAAREGKTSFGLLLLTKGARVEEKDAMGQTPLHRAAFWGHIAFVQLLLSYFADFTVMDHLGQTPLHRAAFWGHIAFVQLLLSYFADFTVMDHLGQTPLDLAVANQHVAIANSLVALTDLLEGGIFSGNPDDTERMQRAVREKKKMESDRTNLKLRLEKERKKSEKKMDKVRKNQGQLEEKRDHLKDKLEQVQEEIKKHLSVSLTPNNPKVVALLSKLKEKEDRLEHEISQLDAKLFLARKKALRKVSVTDRGEAWIRLINE